jgi:glutamyl-tRNA reductase
MAILSLGISFRRSPIELLERLAFTEDDLVKAYRRVHDQPGVEGAVILSTCNRVEAIGDVASYHAGFLGLKRLLTETRGVAPAEMADPLYSHWEADAADHLFAVAGGLDSMVVGETQIQSQVREAFRTAQAEDAVTPGLTSLFHAASRAGKRVRRETGVGMAPDAYVRIACDLAAETLGDLRGREAVIVGAGTMAGMTVHHLRERGAGAIRILNRSLAHARALADRTSSEAGGLDALPEVLAVADLIVAATGAAGNVVGEADVRAATAGRAGRPLLLVDLAVPRDIDPAVAAIENVRLIDVVELRDRVAEAGGAAEDELGRAREIVAEEVARWVLRRRGDELAPIIRALRERGDRIVQAELERHGSRLSTLTPDQQKAVESLARTVASKLLHDPIVGLKQRSGPGIGKTYSKVLTELLRLELPPDGSVDDSAE